jgi:holin (3TMs family)
MLEWLTTGVLGAILKPVINGLLTAQKQKLDAAGSHEARVAELAQKELSLDQREAEVNAAVVIAEQGNWVTRSVRPMLALPVIVLVWKLLIWDKALGQWTHGSTDSLSDQIWWYCTTVTIAYMGGRSLEKVADKIAGIWK